MEFGRIVVLRKRSTGATYELDLGEHSIGSSIDCDLRLNLQNGNLLPKHAVVKVSRNGVAIILNKSAQAPVVINGKPCLKFEALKHGDIFEIIGKQFQYFNESLKDEPESSELFIREKKNLLKLTRKSITPLVKTYTTFKTRSKSFLDKARTRRSFVPARRSAIKSRRNSFPAKCLNVDDTAAKNQTLPMDDSLPIQDNTVHSSENLETSLNFSRAKENSPESQNNISTSTLESDNASILDDSQNNSGNGYPITNDVQLDESEFDPTSYVTVRPSRRRARDISDFPSMSPPHKRSTRSKSIIIIDENDESPINISTSCANNLSETASKLSNSPNKSTFETSTSVDFSDLVLSQSPSLKEEQTLNEDALKDSADPQKNTSITSVNIFDETTQEANEKFRSDQNAPNSLRTTFDQSTQPAIQNSTTLEETKEVPTLNSTAKISDPTDGDFTIEILSPVKPLKPDENDQSYIRRLRRSSVFAKTLSTSLKEPSAQPSKLENNCVDAHSNSLSKSTTSALEDTEIDVVNFTAESCLQVSSVQNESPLRKSCDREPIFTSTPFVKARATEHSTTTDLAKPVKRRSSLRLSVCKVEGPSHPKRVRSLSLPQLPKAEHKKLLSRSVIQPTDPKDLSLKHQIISKRKPEYSCDTTLEMSDVVKDETPKSHIKPVRRLSKVNVSIYNPVVEDVTPVTPDVLEETDCMGDLFKTPTNTAGLFESIRESAIRSPKRARESHGVLFNEKNNSTRTSNQEQPSPQPSSPKPALKKRQNTSPLNRLSSFEGVKRMMKTPAKSPKNDLTNVPNLRKLMSPREQRSPKNNLNNVPNLRKLMSPRKQRSPKNDLTNVPNLRKLMSPRLRQSPRNDLANVTGICSMFEISGLDLLHNDSDDGDSKDLFSRLSGKCPVKSYGGKRKSWSPAKEEREAQNGDCRKSLGATPSCSPRVHQWVEEQLKTQSPGGDGSSGKSPPNPEQTVRVTRSVSSKKPPAEDTSGRKTKGNKAKSNLNFDLQAELVVPGSSGDGNNVASLTCRRSPRQRRTPLKALVNENVLQTPENTVSKVVGRSRKVPASDNVIDQIENDEVKKPTSEIRRKPKFAQAISISESSTPKLEVHVNDLSVGEQNSPAFSLRRGARRRKILSDKDLDMAMEIADPDPLVEDPNAVKTTTLKVPSRTKCVKTTKKQTRSEFALPDVEVKFYEKSDSNRESSPDATTKTKTARLKTRSNSRKGNKEAVLQTPPTDANDSSKKTALKNADTSAGRPTRTRIGARKLREESEALNNSSSSSSVPNSQSIEKDKNAETNLEGAKYLHESLEKPLSTTGKKPARSVKANKTPKKATKGKTTVIDAEVQPGTPNIELGADVVSEKEPTKSDENSSPEMVKTRTRRGKRLPLVSTVIEQTNLEESAPQKVETLIERPSRTRARKPTNNTGKGKKAVSVPSSDETDPKPTTKKPEDTAHTDVEEEKSHSRPKGKKRVIERSASPSKTRRGRKVDSSVEPEADTTQTPIREQTSEKKNMRKQPLAGRKRSKHVNFDLTADDPSENAPTDPSQSAEAEPVKKRGRPQKAKEKSSATLKDNSAEPRVSCLAYRTRSRAKAV